MEIHDFKIRDIQANHSFEFLFTFFSSNWIQFLSFLLNLKRKKNFEGKKTKNLSEVILLIFKLLFSPYTVLFPLSII